MQSGQDFLNYTILEELGSGSMGIVFLAQHKKFDRKVTIKVLDKELYQNDELLQRFRSEARTLSALKHPNIEVVFDYLEEDNQAYLITEFVEGKPLDQYLKDNKLKEKEINPIFLQILQGVGHAHHQNLIHQNLKPSNIIVSPAGQVKVLGFGMPANRNVSAINLQYHGPEVLKNGLIDKRSDIYSLGIILFQMLTNKLPYQGVNDGDTLQALIKDQEIPSPKTVKRSVNDKMVKVVAKATDNMSFQRYQTCEDLRKGIVSGTAIATGVSSEKKGFSFFTFFAIFLALVVVATTYFIVSDMMEDKKQEQLITSVDTSLVREEVILKPKPIVEKKEKEPEVEVIEKTPEQITADSIRAVAVAKQKRIEGYHKARYDKATKNLLIDGQFASEELGQYTINIEVFNKNTDVALKNVTIKVSYYNSKNDVIAKSDQIIPYVAKNEGASIEVTREVNAKRFACELSKVTLAEDENPVILDEDGYPGKPGAAPSTDSTGSAPVPAPAEG